MGIRFVPKMPQLLGHAPRHSDQRCARSASLWLAASRSSCTRCCGTKPSSPGISRQSTRQEPRDPQVGLRRVTAGDAEVGLVHLDAAIEEYHKAIDAGYRNRVVNMAGAYTLQGKMEEAKSVLAEALRANPKLTVKILTERGAVPPALADGLRSGLAEE
jgi:tetratricopeptide (TPR) repeat protein